MPTDVPTPPAPPGATRARRPGWRDPRLWVGVLIVAASVVAGARLLDAADDTVAVWAVAADLGAGDRVTADDLVAQRVRFADGVAGERYFLAEEQLPAELALVRGVGAGELLPRAAVGTVEEAGTVSVPLAVDLVPPTVGDGSVVDVYLTGSAGTPDGPVLDDVVVVEAPALDEGFGATGKRQLVVAVDEATAEQFFARLARVENPLTTVTQVS
ncbi:hypothetical protein [Nocardioides marmotae]|uniref:SAF domain-containing protein n=1 Tax=Nocardioides marmotae TaxID=2663857 RepID=A0A6I3J1R9_9ACTN|nr:hypothetical protein [Nocardioides marmotae]MCR6030650.1 hypothetical protein [Gordonia jinghuaiqii]MBC9734166.1 hypothetical protein [Nocardioides marmotae]MTB85269.1 hypothetical protein [Nocardioides marmotae]MTB94286.1 hypothetical protein [Nocardioides marmotae]QKE00561.1 hypothetical protein HPC71_05310 [Nocardioides marmotae]